MAEKTRLSQGLRADQTEIVRGKQLSFSANDAGKVLCTGRGSGGHVGVGRSPRLAFEDWLEKSALDGRGTE